MEHSRGCLSLLYTHRAVAGPEVYGLGRDGLYPATRADSLVVDGSATTGFVLFRPVVVEKLGESGTCTGDLGLGASRESEWQKRQNKLNVSHN